MALTREQKLQRAFEANAYCTYCKVNNKCTGGSCLSPGGQTFPMCVDADVDYGRDLFDEELYDAHPIIYREGR